MNTLFTIRLGLARGWIEFRQTFTSAQDLWSYLGNSVVFLAVLVFLRGGTVEGTPISVAAMSMPGVLGMLLLFGGVLATMQLLTTEREDGTLLRAKAMPHGMGGYLVGKLLHVSLMTIASMAIVLLPGLFVLDGLMERGLSGIPTLVWVTLLGLLATLPYGAILGSLFGSPRAAVAAVMLPLMGLIVISGIFFPISVLPEPVQWTAQVFPLYWLGLGLRSAFLPDTALPAEIGESWRHLETAGVLGLWAVVGLLIAPAVLRRMARRESGTALERRRHRAMQRVG
ncbi:ABC transporter permease [Marinitenerispora sediminis]|uniref:ABC transporter n=1 Tax=Marinitenerispora sediminis TaxID=1931232 RepID=A0A368TAR7_9ACTN|nr:ABC transporter permease [Marinitenerispora sediminis]RCV50781.1 ABC transporter [Marinitenerispora sediminis]RCV52665.1 ABC transporter [Marinitenerispora sediminis]RCV62081.1 ABC transporter [Marinitenerispora sediminis]